MSFKVLRAIASGWSNYVWPSENIETMAKDRAKICGSCEHANTEKIIEHMMPDRRIVEIKGLGCNLCNCPLSTMLRQVIKRCPDNPPRWN